MYDYARICIFKQRRDMSVQKRFRQGQILKLLSGQPVASQDELRRRLGHLGVRVTQATLSRDLRELRLVKTSEGYRPLANGSGEEAPQLPTLTRALKEFLMDLRAAQNMLVLKTPPSGAQPLAAAVDSEHWKEIAGTLAGDDTVLVICSSRSACGTVQRRLEEMLR